MAKMLQRTTTYNYPDELEVFNNLFPENGKVLLTGGGKEFVERIGIEAIRTAVLCVLSGENLRSQTEPISRRRIAQVSGALVAMFTKGYFTVAQFEERLSHLAVDRLKSARGNAALWPAQWVLGLTGKSIQNVLKSDREQLESYVKEFEKAIADAAKHCLEQYGEHYLMLSSIQEDGSPKVQKLTWHGIARLTTAIGAQTLTIRGSDKSMYGKLFERLVLGSVLTLLGFKRVDRSKNTETHGVFWLSDSTDNRESDATVIVSPGKLARFDIGFIGPGNSEISKDKLSRFGNEVVEEAVTRSSVTFIVVDRLPRTSKTLQAAEKIQAELIQMSMQYWPKQLSAKLKVRFGYESPLEKILDADLDREIKDRIVGIQVQEFLNNVSVEEISEDVELGDTDEIFVDEE